MAVTCVMPVPVGAVIGKAGASAVVTYASSVPLFQIDSSCSTGQVILSRDDLKLRIEPDPIDPARITDMQALFIAFVAVLVALWGAKQLLRLFTDDRD